MTPSSQSATAKRVIGYTVTYVWCRECAPEGIRDSYPPMVKEDDYGVPYACDVCGEELKPCDHEWGRWFAAFGGGEMRTCRKNCGEAERRVAS